MAKVIEEYNISTFKFFISNISDFPIFVQKKSYSIQVIDCELPEQSSEENRSATNPDIDHLLVVYRNQNADEKHERSTKRVNGIGFNKQDAPVLTELAEEYLENGSLTASELETVHRPIAKYRRQWA